MNSPSRCALSVLLLVFHLNAPAQISEPPPIKWGEIPLDDLKMVSYQADSNAAAVILCDYGESEFNKNFQIVHSRHRRIKILSKRGYDWATHQFVLFTFDALQSMVYLEGMTVSLGPDGSILKQELPSESVFKERVDEKHTQIKFTMPSVTPGCILEYRYRIISRSWAYLEDWTFQTREPTRWSEYRYQIPDILRYASVSQGYEKFLIQEQKAYSASYATFGSEYTRGFVSSGSYDYNVHGTAHRLVMKDVPAIRNEPYLTSPKDYFAQIVFQLSLIDIPGTSPKRIMTTWEKLIEEILTSDRFGDQLSGQRGVEREAFSVTQKAVSATEKVKSVYDFVQRGMHWNGSYRYLAGHDLDDVLESKTGSSAEIGLLLTAMLRAVKLDAYPVILSTRSNGKVQENYPLLNQFNHVITYVEADGKEYLLDATDVHRPLGMLPFEALNHKGLLIVDGPAEWIPLLPDRNHVKKTYADVQLLPDGTMRGILRSSDADYSALTKRARLKELKGERFAKDRFNTEESGFSVDSFAVRNEDRLTDPLETEISFSSSSYSQVSGTFVYLNPHFIDRVVENPFRQQERKFPVDFAYGVSDHYDLTLRIPESHQVKEQPRTIAVRLPNNDAEYTRITDVTGTVIKLIRRFNLRKTLFLPEEYQGLREFYEHIVALEAEQIVFELKPLPSQKKK